MKVYHFTYEGTTYEIPRSEIVEIKKEVKASGYPTYDSMLNVMSSPWAIMRYSQIPGTNLLRYLLNFCIYGGRLLLVVAIGLLFFHLWWVSFGLVLCFFFYSFAYSDSN